MSFPEHKEKKKPTSKQESAYYRNENVRSPNAISHVYIHLNIDGIIKCSACGGAAFQNTKKKK